MSKIKVLKHLIGAFQSLDGAQLMKIIEQLYKITMCLVYTYEFNNQVVFFLN